MTLGEYNLWESPRQAKRLLGLVPQEVALYEEFNAKENLFFWGGLYDVSRSELKKNVEEILQRVGLADRAREPVSRYSGGMKRRLNLAIGLVHRPQVLLLDEPTVGIDPQARNAILEIIRDIARQGTTILFTTHHLEEAEKLCDRIAIMDHGRILQTGSVRELAKVVGDRDVVTLRGKFSAGQIQQLPGTRAGLGSERSRPNGHAPPAGRTIRSVLAGGAAWQGRHRAGGPFGPEAHAGECLPQTHGQRAARLKTILQLLLNDLRRDWKRPWATLLLAAMPLFLSILIASVFGGKGGSGPMPTVHVAILDQDKDMLTGMLRSMPSQGDAAKNLRLHFVENRQEGLRLVEKDKVSALVVLPTNMTANLLKGLTNSIELYENPAQQVLPKVVRQGVSLLAVGLSAAAETLGEPLRDVRAMIQSNSFPASGAVGGVASTSIEKLGHLRGYVFPPLVKFETVPAAEFQPLSTNAPTAPPTP